MTDTKSLWEAVVPRYPEFQGQVAIVTGSTRDIGRGIAVRLAREGMRVVVNSRTPSAVEEVTADLRALGADVIGIVADMGKPEDVRRLVDETVKAFGTVDLLVNNAANLKRDRLLEAPEELIVSELDSNILGPYLATRYVAEIMREKRAGNIINISSVAGQQAHYCGTPYDVTKGAIDSMTRVAAIDLGEYGIRVNGVAPGATVGQRGPRDDSPESIGFIRRFPLRCFGTYLDMAAAVAFLASPEAAYITGQTLTVDGGITAQLAPIDAQV